MARLKAAVTPLCDKQVSTVWTQSRLQRSPVDLAMARHCRRPLSGVNVPKLVRRARNAGFKPGPPFAGYGVNGARHDGRKRGMGARMP